MLSTSKITAKSTSKGLQVETECRGFKLLFDEPVEAGGTNAGMNPVEGLLCALGACQSIAAMIFAHGKGIELDSVAMEVEGDVDPDGFMGLNPDARNGLQDVRIKLHLEGPDADALEEVAKLAQERCPVSDCIKNPVPFSEESIIIN